MKEFLSTTRSSVQLVPQYSWFLSTTRSSVQLVNRVDPVQYPVRVLGHLCVQAGVAATSEAHKIWSFHGTAIQKRVHSTSKIFKQVHLLTSKQRDKVIRIDKNGI